MLYFKWMSGPIDFDKATQCLKVSLCLHALLYCGHMDIGAEGIIILFKNNFTYTLFNES